MMRLGAMACRAILVTIAFSDILVESTPSLIRSSTTSQIADGQIGLHGRRVAAAPSEAPITFAPVADISNLAQIIAVPTRTQVVAPSTLAPSRAVPAVSFWPPANAPIWHVLSSSTMEKPIMEVNPTTSAPIKRSPVVLPNFEWPRVSGALHSISPSVNPTILPTATPTLTLTGEPTVEPTVVPTRLTAGPITFAPVISLKSEAPVVNDISVVPSSGPTVELLPSEMPTTASIITPAPSMAISEQPTIAPVLVEGVPSLMPSQVPQNPSNWPSGVPSGSSLPSDSPSPSISVKPSYMPSIEPSISPTLASSMPTIMSSLIPSLALITTFPTLLPTKFPVTNEPSSMTPSNDPTNMPSASPSTSAPTVTVSTSPSLLPSQGPINTATSPPTMYPSAFGEQAASEVPTTVVFNDETKSQPTIARTRSPVAPFFSGAPSSSKKCWVAVSLLLSAAVMW